MSSSSRRPANSNAPASEASGAAAKMPKVPSAPRAQSTNRSHAPTLSMAQMVPTLGRRWLAWSLELAVLAGSAVGPFYLGQQLNQRTAAPTAALSAPLQTVQQQGAKVLGIAPRSLPTHVTPLTNLCWSAAIGLPMLFAAGHIYRVGRSGSSWPKRWLGLQVLSLNGQRPGLGRALIREAVGKWGSPLVVAYGIWQISGAFPVIGVLVGLSGVALFTESLTGLGNRPRRAWHDWLAGTCVVDEKTGAMIHLSSLWDAEAKIPSRLGRAADWLQAVGPTSVIMNPDSARWQGTDLTLPKLGMGLGVLLTLGGLAGVSGYFLLGRPAISTLPTAEENLYPNLVLTLTNPELDPAARRAAVLALGNLPDDRVTPLLVDLIAQTDDPLWLDALQQALVARGPAAFPALRRLNQGLSADLAMQGDQTMQRTTVMRLQTVNRIIAKLLLLEAGEYSQPLDLSRMNLGFVTEGHGDFRLVLKNQTLANTQWQGSVLSQAQFQGARFYSPGPDAHPDTYDDQTANLSGADLSYANLAGADLTLSQLVNSGLVRVNFNRANLTLADLSGANLEHASLIQAVMDQAMLIEARLSKADLTEARLIDVNLTGARLAEITAAGASLSGANLQGVTAIAAQLNSADLSQADMAGADLTGATLQDANLRDANLTAVSLRDADLRGTWLQGAVIDQTDFAGAIFASPPGPSTAASEFVESVPELTPGNQYTAVDFSRGLNLSPEQLTFICVQGGSHPACEAFTP
ncbi:MAG: pentapeptide repeat-containing protein [Cyanobacteria bacterium P01_F01_bin.56]